MRKRISRAYQRAVLSPNPNLALALSSNPKRITAVTLPEAAAVISCGCMRLNALLMTRDQASLAMLTAALGELQIERQVCSSSSEAIERLVQGQFSALILDFALPGAAQVARMARMASPQRRPVVFAMLGVLSPVCGAFQAGVNFVLYKPLDHEQVLRSLRVGQSFMRPNRRNSSRHKLETLVYLQLGIAALPAIVLDLSEQGLALQAAEPLPPVQNVPLRFVLPGTGHMVEAMGEVIWTDDQGRAGMFFSQLTPASRRSLKNWLAKQRVSRKQSVRILLPAPRMRRAMQLSR
jgi:CheY-like chemotaxis protein